MKVGPWDLRASGATGRGNLSEQQGLRAAIGRPAGSSSGAANLFRYPLSFQRVG